MVLTLRKITKRRPRTSPSKLHPTTTLDPLSDVVRAGVQFVLTNIMQRLPDYRLRCSLECECWYERCSAGDLAQQTSMLSLGEA